MHATICLHLQRQLAVSHGAQCSHLLCILASFLMQFYARLGTKAIKPNFVAQAVTLRPFSAHCTGQEQVCASQSKSPLDVQHTIAFVALKSAFTDHVIPLGSDIMLSQSLGLICLSGSPLSVVVSNMKKILQCHAWTVMRAENYNQQLYGYASLIAPASTF